MVKTVARRQYLTGGLVLAIAAIGFFVLLPQLSQFQASFRLLSQARISFVALALAASLSATVLSGLVYQILSLHRLRWFDTQLVELSGLFINRVLPAGIGGLGLNFLYLRAHKHSAAQAGSIVAANNLLGLGGHILITLLIISYYVLSGSKSAVSVPAVSPKFLLVGVIVILMFVIGYAVYSYHSPERLRRFLAQLKTTLAKLAGRPKRLTASLLLSMMMTGANVVSLWLCCHGLRLDISLLAVFIVFSFGIAASTAVPTPGGLGGIEAALVAGLVSQHQTVQTALAAVLLYRLVSFWTGLGIGAVALLAVQKRQLLKY